jgi:hypothetical protein
VGKKIKAQNFVIIRYTMIPLEQAFDDTPDFRQSLLDGENRVLGLDSSVKLLSTLVLQSFDSERGIYTFNIYQH